MARIPTWDDVVAGLAARFYNAYGDDANWLTFDGKPMPRWHDLQPDTRRHWCAGMAEIARPAEVHVDPPSQSPEPLPRPSFRPLRADALDDNPEDK
jgi:hypothetical protein